MGPASASVSVSEADVKPGVVKPQALMGRCLMVVGGFDALLVVSLSLVSRSLNSLPWLPSVLEVESSERVAVCERGVWQKSEYLSKAEHTELVSSSSGREGNLSIGLPGHELAMASSVGPILVCGTFGVSGQRELLPNLDRE